MHPSVITYLHYFQQKHICLDKYGPEEETVYSIPTYQCKRKLIPQTNWLTHSFSPHRLSPLSACSQGEPTPVLDAQFSKQQIHHLQEILEVIWFTDPSQKNLVGSQPGTAPTVSEQIQRQGPTPPQRIATASLDC